MPTPLLPSSGLNGLFHPFVAKIISHAEPGVPKLNPNQNNAASQASRQAAHDFSQLLNASIGDSSVRTQTSLVQTSAERAASEGALPNQTNFDYLQTARSKPSGIPATAGANANVADSAAPSTGDITTTDNAKPRTLAVSIESALPSIAAAGTKDAAEPASSAEIQKPADTQKEDASPASPARSDLSATVVSVQLPVAVAPLLSTPVAQAWDVRSIRTSGTTTPVTAATAQVSVALDNNSKSVADAETLAFQAHLLPEPAGPAHTSVAPAATPQTSAPSLASASAPVVAPASAQGVPQSAASTLQANENVSLVGHDSPACESVGATAANAPASAAPAASAVFSPAPQFEGKSSGENDARPASDLFARVDNVVSLPGQVADIKAPDPIKSTPYSSSMQAMPMQNQDGTAAPHAKTDITFRLQGQSGETVSVRVSDRAGDIQIAVRSTDPATAATLRHDLPTLQSGLERAGWRMETSATSTQPPVTTHQPGRSDGGAPDQSRQDAQSRAEDYSQGGRRRSSPNDRWMEMMNANA